MCVNGKPTPPESVSCNDNQEITSQCQLKLTKGKARCPQDATLAEYNHLSIGIFADNKDLLLPSGLPRGYNSIDDFFFQCLLDKTPKEYETLLRDRLTWPENQGYTWNNLAPYGYDAAWAIALALNKSVEVLKRKRYSIVG